MAKKGYTPEQIINKLREAEVLLSQVLTVGEASRKLGITEQAYYGSLAYRVPWYESRTS
jgi:hypothetical protein